MQLLVDGADQDALIVRQHPPLKLVIHRNRSVAGPPAIGTSTSTQCSRHRDIDPSERPNWAPEKSRDLTQGPAPPKRNIPGKPRGSSVEAPGVEDTPAVRRNINDDATLARTLLRLLGKVVQLRSVGRARDPECSAGSQHTGSTETGGLTAVQLRNTVCTAELPRAGLPRCGIAP